MGQAQGLNHNSDMRSRVALSLGKGDSVRSTDDDVEEDASISVHVRKFIFQGIALPFTKDLRKSGPTLPGATNNDLTCYRAFFMLILDGDASFLSLLKRPEITNQLV